MRSTIFSLAFVLASLANVHAAEEAAMSDTTCYNKGDQEMAKTYIASTEDCQGAIDAAYKLQGGTSGPVGSGCNEVATSGQCAVSICNMDKAGTTVSYGAIAVAAKWIHAICKGNPSTKTTGGYSQVQGYQQPGEPHSKATVVLAKIKRGSKRDVPIESRIVGRRDNGKDKSKPALVPREDNDQQGSVTGTNHIFRRYFVQDLAELEEINQQDLFRLGDRLVTAWNQQQGRSTIVTASITVGDVLYTLSFTAHNNADITRVGRENRSNEVAAFFRLRTRNNNPSTFVAALEVDDGTFLGTMGLVAVDRTPSVGNFFGLQWHIDGAY